MTDSTLKLEGLADEELARRARQGSLHCFEELVRRLQAPLMRMLIRKTSSRTEAEDVAQEAFVRAWEHIARYDDRWPFKTWLFTIAHRQAISRHRAARPTAPPEAMEGRAVSRPGPAEEVSDKDRHKRLWSIARGVLSDEQYTALWLYYVEDMPAPQIARVLEKSWVSVKTMIHRARKSLMPLLSNLAADEQHGAPRSTVQSTAGEL